MIRALGAGLIGISGTVFGIVLSRQLRTQFQTVHMFRDSLFAMQQKISFSKTPLLQMLQEIADTTKGTVSAFFSDCARRLNNNRERTAEAVLKDAFHDAACLGLPQDACLAFERLLSSLGWMDGANQCEAIARAVHEFDIVEEHMRGELAQRGRCYMTLGVCSGIAAAIILI